MENIIIPPKISSLKSNQTICPCCGNKFAGSLFDGCTGCGAQAVGEPLSRPDFQLPSFGRSLFIGTLGTILLIIFLVSTIIAHFERAAFDLDFWSIVSSMEVASWRLKWVAIPLSFASIWVGWKICAGIRLEPKRFMWSKLAHTGLAASILFAMLIATCIGITVPERLRQRQRGFEAEERAKAYLIDKVLFTYRQEYGTLPPTPSDLRKLPDHNGDVALAISYMEKDSTYKPTTDIAGNIHSKTKTPAMRKTLNTTEDSTLETVEFTNYEFRSAGDDGIYGNEDDLVIRDGIITKAESLTPIQIPSTLRKVDKK
jgi:hypothetical protein